MNPTQATILIVEDEASIRAILRIFLESLNYAVVEAQDGSRGLQCYQSLSIDVVLSDIYMPEMNGLELIRAIRRADPEAVIIAMSADPDQLLLAHDAGAQKLLRKPFSLNELDGLLVRARKSIGEHSACSSTT